MYWKEPRFIEFSWDLAFLCVWRIALLWFDVGDEARLCSFKISNNFPWIFQNDNQFVLDPWRHGSFIWKLIVLVGFLWKFSFSKKTIYEITMNFCEIDDNKKFREIGTNEAKFKCLQSIWKWIEYMTTQRERKEGMTIGFKFADSAFFICQSWENCLVTLIRVFWKKKRTYFYYDMLQDRVVILLDKLHRKKMYKPS